MGVEASRVAGKGTGARQETDGIRRKDNYQEVINISKHQAENPIDPQQTSKVGKKMASRQQSVESVSEVTTNVLRELAEDGESSRRDQAIKMPQQQTATENLTE